MNRQQRRQQKRLKQKSDTVYTLTKEQLDDIVENGVKQAVAEAVTLMFAIPMKVIHDNLEWAPENFYWFADKIEAEYQEFSRGTIKVEEYKKLVSELTGMKFVKE